MINLNIYYSSFFQI